MITTIALPEDLKKEFFALSTDDQYEARQEAGRIALRNHMAILKMECPIANGSPKQIDWAIEIFKSFTASANAEGFKHEDLVLFFATYRAKHAKFWIDNRSEKNPYTGYSDRKLQKAIAREIGELKREAAIAPMPEDQLRAKARRF